MAKISFTDRYIRNLKAEGKIKDYSSTNTGFGLRVKPDGTKIFFYRYDSIVTGSRRFVTLGTYPDISLEDARIEYNKKYEMVKGGGDPLESAQLEAAERDAAPTVKDLGDDYIKRHAMVNKKSWKEDKRILEKEVYPAWGRRKAADITKGNIISLLDKVVDRGSPQTANNIFKIIRKMFNFAVKKDILQISPCFGIDMPAPLTAKDRALSADEVKLFWSTITSTESPLRMSAEVKRALQLILVTAQRPAEVSGIHTNEIDGIWWTIPAERSKNKKAHRVPLSPLAQEIITAAIGQIKSDREIPEDQEYRGFIFPCPHRSKVKPIERHALSKALKSNESEDKLTTMGIINFTPHDLRRTAATFMAESGELDEVIDAVLNHTKKGVIKVYNLYRYDKEKQLALESWARKLITFTTATHSNVVSIQTGKKK